MSLVQAIHERWAAAAALQAVLPAARLYTGLCPDAALPWATIDKQSARPVACHNDGSATVAVGVKIDVFHGDHDAGAAIVQQVVAAFDRCDFALAGNDRVVNMRRVNDFERQSDDGVWQFTCEFQCIVFIGGCFQPELGANS